MQRATVQIAGAPDVGRLADLAVRPECGCGSHTAVECADCGALYCDGQGHGRHVCVLAAACLRCQGSGRVARHSGGVAWPEWERRCARTGQLEAGLLRVAPSPEVLSLVQPIPCPVCHGEPRRLLPWPE